MELYLVKKTCPFCGKSNILPVDPGQWMEYEAGALVQDAFPDMSPTEREFLITGMCEDCQREIFG